VKAADLLELLRRRHSDPQEWVFCSEVPDGTGGQLNRFIDAFAINCFHSNDLLKIAYEIKVSRGDFLRELKHDYKRRHAMMLSNQFYFVTPKGLVTPEEIPFDCGLMEAWAGALEVVVKAPKRSTHPPSWTFLVSLCRRLAKGKI